MNCPLCSNPLKKMILESINVKTCSLCGGIWFASGNDFAKVITVNTKEKKAHSSGDNSGKKRFKPSGHFDTISCPSCNNKIQKINYCDDSGIYIHKCPYCQGLWSNISDLKNAAEYIKENPVMTRLGKNLAKMEKDVQVTQEVVNDVPSALITGLYIPIPSFKRQENIPYATIFFTILSTIIFLIQLSFVKNPEVFINSFGSIPANFPHTGSITSIFLHANWLHLLGNMLFMWIFGPHLEDRLGTAQFFILFLLCGVVANIFDIIWRWNSIEPAIGASGSISGLIGAYLVFSPRGRIEILSLLTASPTAPAWAFCISWFIWQLFYGLLLGLNNITTVAYFAHIGGFITGTLIAYAMKRRSIRRERR